MTQSETGVPPPRTSGGGDVSFHTQQHSTKKMAFTPQNKAALPCLHPLRLSFRESLRLPFPQQPLFLQKQNVKDLQEALRLPGLYPRLDFWQPGSPGPPLDGFIGNQRREI